MRSITSCVTRAHELSQAASHDREVLGLIISSPGCANNSTIGVCRAQRRAAIVVLLLTLVVMERCFGDFKACRQHAQWSPRLPPVLGLVTTRLQISTPSAG
jgi:hypothetical protein